MQDLKVDLKKLNSDSCINESIFKDVIHIPLNPSDLSYLVRSFKEKILSNTADMVLLERDIDLYNFFKKVYNEWEKRRASLKSKK